MLVELGVMEQRYQAVLAVIQDGWKVVEAHNRGTDPQRRSPSSCFVSTSARYSYSLDPCTQMNDWISIMSRGRRSAVSRRTTRANSSRLA